MNKILEVHNLCKSFGGVHAVANVSFDMYENEIVGLVGPNGAGKTTVINLITRLLPADDGRILYRGRDITRLPAHRVARMGLVRTFQAGQLFEGLSALENVKVCVVSSSLRDRKLTNWSAANRVTSLSERILNQVSIPTERFNVLAHELTMFERGLVALAMTIALESSVLMLDEPMAGLSPEEIKTIQHLLKDLSTRLSMLVVDHNVWALADISSRLIVMNSGQAIASGQPGEVLAMPVVIETYLGGK